MTRSLGPQGLLLLGLGLVACGAEPQPTTTPAETSPVEVRSVDPPTPTPTTKSPNDSCEALEELARMDPRTPVPLQPMMAWHQKQNMAEHLVAIQRIVAALAEEKWDDVREAAKLIESSPKMAMMCNHMGKGADGFTQMALAFHATADTIAPASLTKQASKVLKATSETLQVCTGCHAKYKQDVVSAKTWQRKTGSNHEAGGAP